MIRPLRMSIICQKLDLILQFKKENLNLFDNTNLSSPSVPVEDPSGLMHRDTSKSDGFPITTFGNDKLVNSAEVQ